jgi:hypothetical protein
MYSVASAETLLDPNARCFQTCLMPSSAQSRTVWMADFGPVPMITASTPVDKRGEAVVAGAFFDPVGVWVDRVDLVAAKNRAAAP